MADNLLGTEYQPILSGHFDETMQSFIVDCITFAMYDDVIGISNYSTNSFQDLVN